MFVSWPTVALLAVLGGLVAALVLGAWEKAAFLDRVRVLETEADLYEFKRLAARDMWMALGLLGVMLSSVTFGMTAVVLGWMGRGEGAATAVAWVAALLVVWVRHIRTEAKLKAMPVAEDLRVELDRVVNVWMTRPFPDWEGNTYIGEDR